MQNQQIPFSKLRLSPANARKSFSEAGVEALAISIDAYGLLQPIIVSPAQDKKSIFYVHAGGRRATRGPLIGHAHWPRSMRYTV